LLGARPSGRTAGLCLVAGVLLAGSLPPWGFWPLAFVGIALLDVLLAGRSRGSRAGRMGLVSFVLFAITLFWIKDLTAPGFVIAAVVFAAMFSVLGALVPPGRGRHLALPAAWVIAEAWKARWPFGGVPISELAIGQVGGPLAGLARLGGVPLLSGATVAVGAIVAAIITGRTMRARLGALGGVVALGALLIAASVAPHGHDIGKSVRMAVVQGGGKQGTQAVFSDMDQVFDRHLHAADTVRPPVDVILWPEDVVDLDEGDIADADSGHGQDLSALARTKGATVIAGIVENSGDTKFLNFSVVVRPDGTYGDRYEKVHRVPFGEYVPLRSLIAPFAGPALTARDAVPGKGPAVVRTDHGTFGVVISREVFFGDRARAAIRDGGQILLNPTNGSTYTLTLVQTQQVAASRLRAIETGRWVVQAAPTGFSAVIDPSGKVLQRTGISEQKVLRAVVPRRAGFTIYTRTGDLPTIAAALALLAAAWLLARRERPDGPDPDPST
jgi:apolipoprotein N-acyltransferase